jgi:putative tryptophan/tyrosine transport system substrate-binding protein
MQHWVLNKVKKSHSVRFFLLAWFVCTFVLGVPGTAGAKPPPVIAVLYPDVREPYRNVFLTILRGIEEGIKGGMVKSLVLKEGSDLSEITAWLEKERIEAVIALGKTGLIAAQTLLKTRRVVVGAVLITPDQNVHGIEGITLVPDPEVIIDYLKRLVPQVKRLTVIYNPKNNKWLIKRAEAAAKPKGLMLSALPAEDLRTAARLYHKALNTLDNKTEALWLLQDDATVDERAILPLILKQAWDRPLIVVSNNPTHVRRGALLSLYPDNIRMGRRLASMVLKGKQNSDLKDRGMVPLIDLHAAVNVRTAEHLGLNLKDRDVRDFELIFPSP